jgi:integrase
MPSVEKSAGQFWIRREGNPAHGLSTYRTGPYKDRREAERVLAASQRMTVSWALSEHLDDLRSYGWHGRENLLSRAIIHSARWDVLIGHIALADLTSRDLSAAYRNLLTVGGLSRKTVSNYRSHLIAALDNCVDQTKEKRNPARHTMIPKNLGKGKKVKPAFSAIELAVITEWAYRVPSKWRLPLLVVCFTGCRRGEALGLRKSDLLADSSVRVVQQLKDIRHEDGSRTAEERDLKTGDTGARIVELPEDLYSEIAALVEFEGPDALVFGMRRPDSFGQWFTRTALPAVNIDKGDRSLHSLRHTMATELLLAGVDAIKVAGQLGHADVTVTLRTYAHLPKRSLVTRGDIAAFAANRVAVHP